MDGQLAAAFLPLLKDRFVGHRVRGAQHERLAGVLTFIQAAVTRDPPSRPGGAIQIEARTRSAAHLSAALRIHFRVVASMAGMFRV